MRDVTQNESSKVYYLDSYKSYGTGKELISRSTKTGSSLHIARGRSDIILSDRVNPTAYRAYRLNIVPNEFSIERVTGLPVREAKFINGKLVYQWYTPVQVAWGKYPMDDLELKQLGIDPITYYPLQDRNIEGKATNKALLRLKESAIDLSQSLGEIRTTYDMMKRRAMQIMRGIHLLFRKKWKAAAREFGIRNRSNRLNRAMKYGTKTASNMWLEFWFGWKPLVMDIWNGYGTIRKILDKNPHVRVTATHVQDGLSLFQQLRYSFDGGEGARISGAQCGLLATLSDRFTDGLLSLGIGNPVSMAWNLLPMSWMIDWLVQVGDFLEACSAPAGLVFQSGYLTRFEKAKGTMRFWWPIAGSTWHGKFPSWKCNTFTMNRVPLPLMPLPAITFGSKPTALKASIAAALIGQRFVR